MFLNQGLTYGATSAIGGVRPKARSWLLIKLFTNVCFSPHSLGRLRPHNLRLFPLEGHFGWRT